MLKKKSFIYLLFESGKITWITEYKHGEIFIPWRMIENGFLKRPEACYYIVKKTLEENNISVDTIFCISLFGKEKELEIFIPNLEDQDIPGFIDFELRRKYPDNKITYTQGKIQGEKWTLYILEEKTVQSYEIFKHLGKSCHIMGIHQFINQKGRNIKENYLFPSPEGMIFLKGTNIFKIKKSIDEFISKNKYGTKDFYKFLENKFVEEDSSFEPLENSWNIYLMQIFSQLFKEKEDKNIYVHDLVPSNILKMFTEGTVMEGISWWNLPLEWEMKVNKRHPISLKELSFYKMVSLVSLISVVFCFLHYTFIFPRNMLKDYEITGKNLIFQPATFQRKGIYDLKVYWKDDYIKVSGRAKNEKIIEKYHKELSESFGHVKLTSLTEDDSQYFFLIESR